jgi:hypothetical protein
MARFLLKDLARV